MPQPQAKGSYTAGHFEFLLDGAPSTAYLKSVDGGYVKASLIDEPIGPDQLRIKHTSTVDIEPFAVEFGLSGSEDVLKWIQASWRRQWSRRNGAINHANFDLYKTFEHEFYSALISETAFPTLDGSSKDAAYLKLKFQPEKVVARKVASQQRVAGVQGMKFKHWSSSAFRLNIDGFDNVKYTNKIEGFTIKQGIKKLYTGEDRFPQIEPTKIEFPNLTCNISLAYADELLKWYDKFVVNGEADTKAEKTGSLEFLSQDRASTLFRINLYNVGLSSLQVLQSAAKVEQIKRVKFELYVGRMDIDGVAGMDGGA